LARRVYLLCVNAPVYTSLSCGNILRVALCAYTIYCYYFDVFVAAAAAAAADDVIIIIIIIITMY